MQTIWEIKLKLKRNGRYQVTIAGEGGRAKGEGMTAYAAYQYAEMQLVIKPALDWLKP
jgi:hypothetical protein